MKQTIIFLSLFAILSCNPYKRVATDVNRTDKNKAILLNTCLATFPPLPPTYIKGKDSIYTQHDTAYQTVIEVKNDTIYKTQLKTITVTNTVTRTDTLIKENTFAITKINSDLRICEKENDLINNKLTISQETASTNFKRFIFTLIPLIGLIITWVLIKLKQLR